MGKTSSQSVMDYKYICDQVCCVAKQAGGFIREQRGCFDLSKVEHKGEFDLVSYVDKGAEKIIVSCLSDLVADATFITEEGTVAQQKSDYFWVIDPLDGTTNFVHGLSPYCVSIALMHGEQPVVGVVYEVTADECFSAYLGGKAMLNGLEIRVSNIARIEDSLVIGGFAHKISSQEYKKSIETFDFFNRITHGVRRIGSAAANLAYIAAGRADAFYQIGLSSWDVAAGALIVKCAGGEVGDYRGGDNYVFGREIIASNKELFNFFLNKLA